MGHSKDLATNNITRNNFSEKTSTLGHKALRLEEDLIFELDSPGITGVDFPNFRSKKDKLGTLKRRTKIGLPGLSEPEVIRHFTRLSQKNYAIDTGIYPLGSCTMKHNPRLNEKLARLKGFSNLHPLQPIETVQGALELIDETANWLKKLTGMPAIAMSPAAGAHGELCGMMAIRSALDARDGPDSYRRRVLVPESAHGTNPATAVVCGFKVDSIPANSSGRVDVLSFKEKLGDDVAAVMLTNPNTCGLFESDILEISRLIHECGGFFYCDGANFNAIVGRVRPGDLGVECMHINLHKTFSTPHGGGGPGAGPVVFSEALASFVPRPWVVSRENGFSIIENDEDKGDLSPIGRMKAFHGQMGMFIRTYAYLLSHGGDGLFQASGDAVLNANYIMAELCDYLSPSYDGPSMHECLFDDRFLDGTGLTTLDFSKAMIDEGYHPMTMYFPLIVHGAMLIEPTETESKKSLDDFITVMRQLAIDAKSGENNRFLRAPEFTPRRRLDETKAARQPVLRWKEKGNAQIKASQQ